MNKAECAERFARKYNRLTETERNTFSRISNKLLSASFICESRQNDRNDYYDAVHRISYYQDYFAILDYEIIHHVNEKVIQLISTERYNHFNLKLDESIALLLLRRLYAVKAREIALHENIIITIEELHEAMEEIGFKNRRINKTDFREIIRLFKRFSLLDNVGDLDKDETMLVLYPSILFAVPYNDITELSTMIRNYKGESNETADEDSLD